MLEDKHVPTVIDGGVDMNESVIKSVIQRSSGQWVVLDSRSPTKHPNGGCAIPTIET